jgi:hypothetical protein
MVPRISRNAPVSPGTATFAMVPYMNAHNPRAAIYTQVKGAFQIRLVLGKQLRFLAVNLVVHSRKTSRVREILCSSIQCCIETF